MQQKWREVTREERFFTCTLYQDILEDPEPLLTLLRDKLGLPASTSISDTGYEVCFFRDAYHARPILISDRRKELEKRTFDLVLWLSDHSMLIIEAKAQQGFHTKQLKMLDESKRLIPELSVPDYPVAKVILVALCSSHYRIKESTSSQFACVIRWHEIAEKYPAHESDYERADGLYGK